SVILLAVIGFILGGVPLLVLGAIFGWFFGWFSFWLYEGRYRAKVAPYLTPGQVLWHFAFRIICGAI
ncbi:MAG TPA: polyamine ABC transporter permease, partial [Sulfitobacter sp.]|nr:polyamine ABC transporter permease [Sulfitobacter sp.]